MCPSRPWWWPDQASAAALSLASVSANTLRRSHAVVAQRNGVHILDTRDRMGHRDVRHHALAEERALALVGTVDELVDQHECARRKILTKRAAGR